MSRKSALDDLFGKYAAAVRNLLQYVEALFDEEFTEWHNAARQFVYAESTLVSTPGVVSLETPRRTPPRMPS